jgi:hypothetical protein
MMLLCNLIGCLPAACPTDPKPVNTSPRLRAVAHHRCPTVFIPMLGELRRELVEHRLQRLGNQPLGTFAQRRAQQSLPLWLVQWNYRIHFSWWRDSLCGR